MCVIQTAEMTEYWLISAPGDKTCQQTWETMNNVTSKQNNLSDNYKFHIPDLKVRHSLEIKDV
jgi:V-type H+-transporting ATPase subunit C